MRESSMALLGRTVWKNDVGISGQELLAAIDAAFNDERLKAHFTVTHSEHDIDGRILTRPRMLHTRGFGYMLVKDFERCVPVVIDPRGTYDRVLIAIDHWGHNFRNEQHKDGFLGVRRREIGIIAAAINMEISRARGTQR